MSEINNRRSSTKSRNGCVSCKTRRKKCDEKKPRCGGCSRLNLECKYIKKIHWNSGNQISHQGGRWITTRSPCEHFLVYTSKDIRLSMLLNDIPHALGQSYSEFNVKRSIHEDVDFQNIVNSEENINIENDLFEYYVTVISGKKVFSDGLLNEFRSIIIPNSIISPALFQSIIALSASDINKRNPNARNGYYSRLTSKYKNDAISSIYTMLDEPEPEILDDIGICILMLCTLEIGENGNDNWINYLKQSCLIFQSIDNESIMRSKPLLFCYRYFTLRYILLLTTLNRVECSSIACQFPMKWIPEFFDNQNIDYMLGCSPQLIRVIRDINHLKNNVDIQRIRDLTEEVTQIKQIPFECEDDHRIILCSQLYYLTTKLYLWNSFQKYKDVLKFNKDDFDAEQLLKQSLELLQVILNETNSNLFPTWPLFILSIAGIRRSDDSIRVEILKMIKSIEITWPKSSLTMIRWAITLVWKNHDLNPDIDWRDVLTLMGIKVCLT